MNLRLRRVFQWLARERLVSADSRRNELGNRCSIRLSYGATKSYETLVADLVADFPIFNRSAIT